MSGSTTNNIDASAFACLRRAHPHPPDGSGEITPLVDGYLVSDICDAERHCDQTS